MTNGTTTIDLIYSTLFSSILFVECVTSSTDCLKGCVSVSLFSISCWLFYSKTLKNKFYLSIFCFLHHSHLMHSRPKTLCKVQQSIFKAELVVGSQASYIGNTCQLLDKQKPLSFSRLNIPFVSLLVSRNTFYQFLLFILGISICC